jgi:hypothetical protein
MNLSDMAGLICEEMGLFDDTSVGLAKAFLNRQYQSLWDKYPWGDATGYGNAQVDAGTTLVDYPVGMDRIITMRASTGSTISPPPNPYEPPNPEDPPPDPDAAPNPQLSRFIDPIDSTFLIESEPTIFEEEGYVRYYEEIGTATGRQIRLYPIPVTVRHCFSVK